MGGVSREGAGRGGGASRQLLAPPEFRFNPAVAPAPRATRINFWTGSSAPRLPLVPASSSVPFLFHVHVLHFSPSLLPQPTCSFSVIFDSTILSFLTGSMFVLFDNYARKSLICDWFLGTFIYIK